MAETQEKRSETVSATVTPSMLAEIEAIGAEHDRTRSWIVGALLERGLELYRRDKLLKSKLRDNKVGVIRARVEDAPRRSKKA